jgi:hypothetical protein
VLFRSRSRIEGDKDVIRVELTVDEHEALLSMLILDDRLMELVKSAKPAPHDIMVLEGRRADIDELAGWVASECNHEKKKRRAALLSEACDGIEAALRRG